MTTNVFSKFQAKAAITQEASKPPLPMRATVNKLEFKKQIADESGLADYMQYAEIERIIGLPIMRQMDKAELEAYNQNNVLAEAYESGFRLFDIQAEGAAGYEMADGGFFPIGVGWGKTLLSLLIADKAFRKGLRRMVYFCPPQVLNQFVETDIKWARTRIPISFPIHVLGGRNISGRRALSGSNKRGLYVFPYSLLSTKDSSDNLIAIRPELLICDEAHRLANRTAARTKRVLHYIEEFKPEVVVMSGTITRKRIRDYWHLIRAALGKFNPLPNSASLASDWGSLIDADGGSTNTGPLLPLVYWAQRFFPEMKHLFTEDIAGFRKAYRQRMTTAPGVVASGDAEIGTSLTICNDKIENHEECEGWAELDALGKMVEDEWITPNGDPIDHAIHTFKWRYEIYGAGFYNQLTWPSDEEYARRKNISKDQAAEILAKAIIHHAADSVFVSALRGWLEKESRPGLDTPLLVRQNMARDGAQHVGDELYSLWCDVKDADFEGRPDRDSTAIRVCPFKINAAVRWAKALPAGTGALMWVYHQEVGAWLSEELQKAGVNVLYCPAGKQANISIADPANGGRVIVASMTAHGEGKNLQHFHEQYFVQWPRPAVTAEQTLGRTHRSGQKADELFVYTNAVTEFDRENFSACLVDALYIHQTTGNRQKLIYANYDPVPDIFPPEVLRERGFENRLLTAEQRRILNDKFGDKK